MKKNHQRVAGILATALVGTAAWAGQKTASPVVVNSTSRKAWGSLASARDTADNIQNIGCQVNTPASGPPSVLCFAQGPTSPMVTCYSTNAALVEAARDIHGDSYLYFAWDTIGTCTNISVANASQYAPKAP
ncbi:hypothetical protein ACN469_14965 [Corallococcus terminator]